MNCKKVKENLSTFIDQQLKAEEKREILEHLDQCPDCANELQILTKTWKMLGIWGKVKTSEQFELKFWERIKVEEKKKPSLVTTLRDFAKLPGQAGSPDKWKDFYSSVLSLSKELFRIPLPVAVTALILLGIFSGIYLNRILQAQQNEATISTLSNLYSLNGYSTESLNEILLTGGN